MGVSGAAKITRSHAGCIGQVLRGKEIGLGRVTSANKVLRRRT